MLLGPIPCVVKRPKRPDRRRCAGPPPAFRSGRRAPGGDALPGVFTMLQQVVAHAAEALSHSPDRPCGFRRLP